MKQQKGYPMTRYFVIGILVTGMVVNTAAARRLFKRCVPRCIPRCSCGIRLACEVCPTGSADQQISNCEINDSAIVTESPCAVEETISVDSTCQNCETETQLDFAPIVVDEYASEPVVEPAPALTEWIVPAEVIESPVIESPVDPPVSQQITPPAMLPDPEVTAPEVVAPEVTAPAESEGLITPPSPEPEASQPPAATDVGDRYSSSNDLFEPATPEEAPTPAPTPESTPAADPSTDDLFEEPIAPPVEKEDTPRVPEAQPQPQPEVEDLFGPLEPTEAADFTEAPGTSNPEAEVEEVKEIPETQVPAPQEPATTEPVPTEPDPEDSEKGSDPFGEDWTTGVEDETSVLEEAGGLQSRTERTWTDNSASFQCEARLLRVTAKNVVLRQSTGTERIVPLARLANVDLLFIRKQITALRVVRARDAEAEKLLAVVWGK